MCITSLAGAQNIDYTYDPVGNQKSDPHKGITITYNYLNLPSVILWSNGNKMEISYDAVGTKLSKKVSIGATEQYTQHYLGGIEYNAVGTTRKLEAIYFTDGRVYNTNVTTTSTTVALRFEYAIRDHLGNTRLMFADQGTTPDGVISASEILQENHYYPFGMNMEGAWMNDAASKDSKYQYNGKELNDDFGLGWSDYGARWYDAGIGRWGQVDNMVEKYNSLSPYNYVDNTPINGIDPDGNDFILTVQRNEKGEITGISISTTIFIMGDGASEDKAEELNDFARKNLKSKTFEGINVSFDVKYKYSPAKKKENLKGGENLLEFKSIPDDKNHRSGISAKIVISKDDKLGTFIDSYTGNNGIIYGSGKENSIILHETMHLLGLSDRYYESGGGDEGFEDDIMYKRGSTSVDDFHYMRYISTMYENYPHKDLPGSNRPRIIRKHIDKDYEGSRLQKPSKK